MEDVIKVGLIGCGNVGGGVVKILLENAENIALRAGCRIELAKVVVRNMDKQRPYEVAGYLLGTDALALVNDPSIDVIVETIGGENPARELIMTALRNGKHVVTANKEVIAKHGSEFLQIAREHGVNLYYEAAVAGGIPIIHGLKNSLAANNISKIVGIMNGTTNYILTKMYQEGAEFATVLAEAQKLGFAEADPSDDIEGDDVAYKLSILAGIAFNSSFKYEDIYFEGIEGISAREIEVARKLGFVIKLVAIGQAHADGRVELRVHPVMMDEWHPLAGVNNVFNAVFIEGSYVGQTMFYGPGAGMCPTASAVVGDVMDIAMHRKLGVSHPSIHTNFQKKEVVPIGEIQSEYYFRLSVTDKPGVLAAIAHACGEAMVSIKSVEQKQSKGEAAEVIIITHTVRESAMQKALAAIRKLDTVSAVHALIRVGL